MSRSRTTPTLRDRLRAAARRRVQLWIFGYEANFPGDARRRIVHDETTSAPLRLVQYHRADGYPVRVGRYTALASSATILQGGLHHPEWVGVAHAHLDDNGELAIPSGALRSKGPVVIGSDVLVGFEALILSGVTIGDGAVIAPRAVVTRDVEPFEIVGGNPARHIRYRFDEPTREALLRIAWWDWPDEKVRRHRNEIDSADVDAFIARHDPARAEAFAS
jgi:acetyltransferase-like isoleucine patch superfamily enzyme